MVVSHIILQFARCLLRLRYINVNDVLLRTLGMPSLSIPFIHSDQAAYAVGSLFSGSTWVMPPAASRWDVLRLPPMQPSSRCDFCSQARGDGEFDGFCHSFRITNPAFLFLRFHFERTLFCPKYGVTFGSFSLSKGLHLGDYDFVGASQEN